MGVKLSEDGTYITYGPYRDGDKPEFTADPVGATVSFDIFNYKVRDSKLYHPDYSKISCCTEDDNKCGCWYVVDSHGIIADKIENLYFTFPNKQDAHAKSDAEDTVNHPKHYTGHKADVECIMFTELLPSLAANAFKYVWRCDDKGNKTEDLEKARWYLKRACTIGYVEHIPGRRTRYLMSDLIEASDFDDWHKRVLTAIINGYYVDAYDTIADLIGKPRYTFGVSEF